MKTWNQLGWVKYMPRHIIIILIGSGFL